MNKITNFIKENKITIAICLLWLLVASLITFNHELWRDEAYPWVEIKTSPFLSFIDSIIRQGHLFLWHTILFPFAKLNFPIESIQFLSVFLTMGAVYILLKKAPFNIFLKLLLIFSTGFIYYFPAISRCYALIPLVLFALAQIYPKRGVKPYIYSLLLILLSQTHFLMLGGLCFVLMLIYSFENLKLVFKDKSWNFLIPNFILWGYYIGTFFIYFTRLQTKGLDVNPFKIEYFNNFDAYSSTINTLFSTLGINNELVVIVTIASILIAICYLFLKSKKSFFIISYSVLFVFIVLSKIWLGGIVQQKIFLIPLIILFGYWICENKSKLNQVIITIFFFIFFLVQIPQYEIVKEDIINDFSDGKTACKFLKQINPQNKKIAVINDENLFLTTMTGYCPSFEFISLLPEEEIPQDVDYVIETNFIDSKIKLPSNYVKVYENDKNRWNDAKYQMCYFSAEKFVVYKKQ